MYKYTIDSLPHVSMMGRVAETRGWSHSGRHMNVNLLFILHSGNCTLEIDGKIFEAQKGDVILIPKGTFYRPHTNTKAEYTFFHFDGDIESCDPECTHVPSFMDATNTQPICGTIEKGCHTLLFNSKMTISDDYSDIELILTRCLKSYDSYNEMLELILSIQFCEILFKISQSYCKQFEVDKSFPPAVNRLLLYIHAHYTEKITLNELCNELNMSKQYCMRIFKKYMHTTINDYVLSTKMKHAAYLLRHTYMNISEASSYLGFTSVSYFSRVFKQYYGVSPSEYFI